MVSSMASITWAECVTQRKLSRLCREASTREATSASKAITTRAPTAAILDVRDRNMAQRLTGEG